MAALRDEAARVMEKAIADVMPAKAVQNALREFHPGSGKLILIAIGKAAWEMAYAASEILGNRITRGLVITKYGHLRGEINRMALYEAGHPYPDENSVLATDRAIALVRDLTEEDRVLFLVSGGGSALFEKPLIPLSELKSLTAQFLASGASINEINLLRKRLSAVKGGKFARLCAPARVFSILLSDVLGDPPDRIASGPTVPDPSTVEDVRAVLRKYRYACSEKALGLLQKETPKTLPNASFRITGSVRQLCASAKETLTALGYETFCLTSGLDCEAREAGAFLSAIAREHQGSNRSLAFLAGGETVVHVTGSGLGGRNQELALSAANGLEGCRDTCVFSFGSDGTDGPTDAAGGYADENTASLLRGKGISISETLRNNDAYHALAACGGLLKTGPTGTNVNDLSVLMIHRPLSVNSMEDVK